LVGVSTAVGGLLATPSSPLRNAVGEFAAAMSAVLQTMSWSR